MSGARQRWGPQLSSGLSAGPFYRVEGPRQECRRQGQKHRKEVRDLPNQTLT